MLTKATIVLSAATVLAAASVVPAAATQYCASYTSGGKNCGFSSLPQCQAAVSGVGGFCSASPEPRLVQHPGQAAPLGPFARVKYPVRTFARDPAEETRVDRAKGGIR